LQPDIRQKSATAPKSEETKDNDVSPVIQQTLAININIRIVFQTIKDREGDILALCNHNAHWSPRYKQDAIKDIENGFHSYAVRWSDGKKTPVRVVNTTAVAGLQTALAQQTCLSINSAMHLTNLFFFGMI
jgi:hypothetical protein